MPPAASPADDHQDWKNQLYQRLAEDDEGRVCLDISDRACRETPGNFLLTLAANTLTSVGDRVASAKTTLPWLLGALGAPAWCLSLLVPIRESGSMLPQIWLGALARRQPLRKGIWAVGSATQGLCLLGIALAALSLDGLAAGLIALTLLAIFSLGRGACSLAYKDVLGKTIPKSRRGRLSGWIGAVAGLAAMAVGLGLARFGEAETPKLYSAMLAAAGALWFVAALVYLRIREFPGATEGGTNGLTTALAKLRLLADDPPFRRFVAARALAMGSGLAAPFYIVLAREDVGNAASILGTFMAAEGLAGLVSAPFWGRWADRSSRHVFAAGSALAATLSTLVALWSWQSFSAEAAKWFYPIVFFGLGLAHSGVRLGRKTYLVDMAQGDRRTDYVAVSNSVIGALLLLSGLLSAAAALLSIEAAILLLAFAGFASAALSLRWTEV